MAQIFPPWWNKLPIVAAIAGSLGPTLAVAGVWYYFSPWYINVGYRPIQPVPYSHKLHVGELGLDCRYCHASVEISGVANVPPTQTCMNCHQLVKRDSEKLAPIRDSAATGRPMRWIRVHDLRRLRVFHPPLPRGGRNRLCHLPRPHRRDGNGHGDDAPQHELVPRLPPQSRSLQTTGLRGHQHEVDPSQRPPTARGAARRASDRSIRRLTVRGATGDADLLAKCRAARGAPRIPRLSRAGVPGGSLGASRRRNPARDDHAPGRHAVARGCLRVPAPRRRNCPVCHRSRGNRPRRSRATTRRQCRSGGALTA